MSLIKLTVKKENTVDVTDYVKIFNSNQIVSFETTTDASGGTDVVYRTGAATFTTYLVSQSESDILDAMGIDTPDFVGLGAVAFGGTEAVTTAGALSLSVTNSIITAATNGIALTLADGINGQFKFLKSKHANDAVVTPSTLVGGTTITLDTANDFCLLYFTDSAWHIIVNSGCTVA